VADYELPDDLRYSREDEWARAEDDRVMVGITDYAQEQLGDIVFVELPQPGESFNRGDSFGVVESVKAVSDLFAPISGEIIDTNEELVDRPEAVNEACYGEGWIVAIAPSDPSELDALLDAETYRKYLEERGE
jgi:glycine cleavage system H protein